MTSLKKMVQKDAFEFARAEMFFGEGAGVRRRQIGALVGERSNSIPGYEEAFDAAYKAQDMAEHAIKAAKERQTIDRLAAANRNLKAFQRGDVRGLSTGVFLAAGAVWLAHETGYDKKIKHEAKELYSRVRLEVERKKRSWTNK